MERMTRKLRVHAPELATFNTKAPGIFTESCYSHFGADDEARTRDPQLGKLMLYQLSYYRRGLVLCCDNDAA